MRRRVAGDSPAVTCGAWDPMTTEIRRADQRFRTRTEWLDSRHSFSFGPHYDPANTHFGLLHGEQRRRRPAGTGFDTHPHRDMEIVTWVLSGALVHQDSTGHSGVIHPGLAQRMSAGTGILHSEKNDASARDVHFVQMWVVPDTEKITPGYEQLDIGAALESGELLVVASGMPRHRHESAISIRQEHAALYAARLDARRGHGVAGGADGPPVRRPWLRGAGGRRGARHRGRCTDHRC